jgi:crotonobetainyl-CoA:carnitine CoA-transferase CaiB-like acyl-CoA transferase
MWAVVAILAALQERGRTGRGGVVDTSLYETTLAWMTLPISAYLANGEAPQRFGSGVEQIVPYQAFAAADGHIMVAAGNDNLFRRLCTAIGRSGLAEDPRFLTNSDRVVNRRALIAILSDIFAAQPVAAWAARLDAAGIPNGPIQTVDQVVADAQTAALGIIQQMVQQSGSISLVGLPLSFDGARPPLAKLAPRLGEDNREILDPPA